MQNIPELDKKGLRKFGLTTGGIVAVLFGLLFPWLLDADIPMWPFIIAGVLGAWALIAPGTLRPVYIGWMRIGLVIGAVMSRLILGIVFYLIITPMGVVRRMLGKDTVERQFDEGVDTYKIKCGPLQLKNMEKPF